MADHPKVVMEPFNINVEGCVGGSSCSKFVVIRYTGAPFSHGWNSVDLNMSLVIILLT